MKIRWGTLAAVFLLSVTELFAQPDLLWTRTLPGTAFAARELPDGNLVIAGYIYKNAYRGPFAFATLLQATGDTIWTRTFGRLAEEDSLISTEGGPETVTRDGKPIRIIVGDSHNHVRDVFALADGSVLLATSLTPDSSHDNCRCLIHLDSHGDSLGCRYLCTDPTDPLRGIMFGMNQTPTGDIIAFGNDELRVMNGQKYFILRLDSQGDTLALHHIERDCHSFPTFIQVSSDGGFVLAGTSGISSLTRVDADGDLMWYVCTKGSRDGSIVGACPTHDGGVITLGATQSLTRPPMRPHDKNAPKGERNADSYLVKYSAKGDTIWHYTCSGSETNSARLGVELPSGNLVVAGMTGEWRQDHPYLMGITSQGDSLWSTSVGSGEVRSLIKTQDGGVVLVSSQHASESIAGFTVVTKLAPPQ